MSSDPVHLAPPGAGLPLLESVLGRYFLFPSYCRKTSWDKASGVFARQGERILGLAAGLTDEQLGQRVLIARPKGLEDSSRHWSIAMALEHLVIVGELMARAIVLLSQGELPAEVASTATVKPTGTIAPQAAIAGFRRFQEEYARAVAEQVGDRGSKATFRHPWFGPLTAHGWHCMAGLHQGAHRKQVEAIRAGLGAPPLPPRA